MREHTFKGEGIDLRAETTVPPDCSSTEELGHTQQLLAEILLLYFRSCLSGWCIGGFLPESLQLLVRLLELRLLGS